MVRKEPIHSILEAGERPVDVWVANAMQILVDVLLLPLHALCAWLCY